MTVDPVLALNSYSGNYFDLPDRDMVVIQIFGGLNPPYISAIGIVTFLPQPQLQPLSAITMVVTRFTSITIKISRP